MNIKVRDILIAHTVAAHIAFVSKYQSGCKRTYRYTCALIVISDSGNYLPDLIGRKIQVIQNTESHYRARLTVLHTIYEIANIMQISCYLYKLDRSLRIAESLQDVSCLFSYQRYMGKAVLGKSECRQRQICLTDIGIDLLILLDLLICHDYSSFRMSDMMFLGNTAQILYSVALNIILMTA